MIYTIEEIRNRILPVAEKYKLPAVNLFGSYARGTAQDNSDIDLLIDTTGTALTGLFALGTVYCELEEALGKKIDLITVSALQQTARAPSEELFRNTVWKEKVNLYMAA